MIENSTELIKFTYKKFVSDIKLSFNKVLTEDKQVIIDRISSENISTFMMNNSDLSLEDYIKINSMMDSEWQNFQYTLLYKATRDGFNSIDFRNKCNGTRGILIIVNTRNGNKFGGFTPLTINSSGGWIQDQNLQTFIFSLDNNTKFSLSDKDKAIKDHSSSFPDFGDDGISIYSYANNNSKSSAKIQGSFKNMSVNISYDSLEAKKYLGGDVNFYINEILTFQVNRR